MSEHLTVASEGGVTTVTLLHTTMPPVFFADCEEAFRRIAGDRETRVVVIRSSAKHFSYGLDLPAAFAAFGPIFSGGGARDRADLKALIGKLQGAFNAIASCPVPVVAAVQGRCIGGGLDLIAAADIRLASSDASFSLRETKIAIVADLGSLQRLPAIIGKGHTRELAFTAKDIDAQRALAIGLVNDVLPGRDELAAAASAMAKEIAANPPLTVRGVKDVLDFGEGKSVAEGLAYVAAYNAAMLASEDLGEAMTAFTSKREPVYKGR